MTTLPRPDLHARHPLSEWNIAWLRLDVAVALDDDLYIVMTNAEKEQKGYPITREEMIDYITEHGSLPAAGL